MKLTGFIPAVKTIVIIICMASISSTLFGQSASGKLKKVMNHYYPANEPGAALLVIKDGKTLIQTGFGIANMETGEKIDDDTHFRMASVSKQFTAMCILILERQYKLSIYDPVKKYLPELPAFAGDITIEHFLTHTSGIADYESLIPDGQKEQISDADVLRLVSLSKQLYFTPGTKYRYSNTAFCLLTQIVEKVSGQTYPEFIKQYIFLPLGMEYSTIYDKNRPIYKRAFGYHFKGDGWQFADQSTTSATMGDGSVYTSINEYQNWIKKLWSDKAAGIQPDPMTAHSHIATGLDYGYGWFVAKEKDGSQVYFHSGESTGFHNIVYQNPSRNLLVILFSNCDDDRVSHAFKEISGILDIRIETVPETESLFDFLSDIYDGE